MREYKFSKPLVENPTPPQSTDTYWVDVDEPTGKLLTIFEFDKEEGVWMPSMIADGYYKVICHVFGAHLKMHCDRGLATSDSIVTVTAEPDEGYEVHVEVEWAGGKVELTEIDENTWTFEMPNGNVDVKGSAEFDYSKLPLRIKNVGDSQTEIYFVDKRHSSGDLHLPTFKYSLNGGEYQDWIYSDTTIENYNVAKETEHIALNEGEYIDIVGVNNTTVSNCHSALDEQYCFVNEDGELELSGSIMSLINGDPTEKVVSGGQFMGLFYEVTSDVYVDNLRLPATTLSSMCYRSMFMNVNSIHGMLRLPAKTLVGGCYNYLLGEDASNDFKIKVGFTDWVNSCTSNWLPAGNEDNIFICPEELDTSIRSNSRIPEDWTIQTY